MKKYIDLSQYNEKLTIAELKKAIEQEEEVNKLKENKEINLIKEKYQNTYLKYIEEDGIFGKTLNVIQLKEFVRTERTTDWELIYYFEGREISFSENNLFYKVFDTNRCSNSFSAKELKKTEIITEEDYLNYENKYKKIKTELENLIE
jgi:hypothetical protein